VIYRLHQTQVGPSVAFTFWHAISLGELRRSVRQHQLLLLKVMS
jgi:hypothetical protein